MREVLDIQAEAIEPPPAMGLNCNQDYILGMGKIGDRIKILLDIEKVLGRSALEVMDTIKHNLEEENLDPVSEEALSGSAI